MCCFDVVLVLLEGLGEGSLIEEGIGGVCQTGLEEVLVYDGVEFVRSDGDGHGYVAAKNK